MRASVRHAIASVWLVLLGAAAPAAAAGWTFDGGGPGRGKFVQSGGLPVGFDAARLEQLSQPALPYAVMVLTRSPDELVVYGADPARQVQRRRLLRRAGLGSRYLARVEATRLEVLQRVDFDGVPWVGGALVHPNGDLYAVNGTSLYRFAGGDLGRAQEVALPEINGLLTLYNGLIAMGDGRLVTKGWALERQDGVTSLIVSRVARVALLAALVSAVLFVVLSLRRGPWVMARRGAAGAAVGVAAFGLGLVAATGTDPVKFMGPEDPGVLLVLDPVDLHVIERVTPPERLAFCRLTVAPAGQGEWLLATGTEHLYRWRYAAGGLRLDEAFTEQYRAVGDGSSVGTAVVTDSKAVFFNDNVSPAGLTADRYRLYRKALDGKTGLQVVDLAVGMPGFQYWSPAVAKAQGALIVWDTHAGVVQARRLEDLAPMWRRNLYVMDGISVAADRGHVYVGDYGRAFSLSEHLELIRMGAQPPPTQKTLTVLDAGSGETLGAVQIGGQYSSVMGLIVPGAHDDVFVPTRDALIRVFLP